MRLVSRISEKQIGTNQMRQAPTPPAPSIRPLERRLHHPHRHLDERRRVHVEGLPQRRLQRVRRRAPEAPAPPKDSAIRTKSGLCRFAPMGWSLNRRTCSRSTLPNALSLNTTVTRLMPYCTARSQLLHVVHEAAVAGNADHGRVRPRHLRPQRRRKGEPQVPRVRRRDVRARLVHRVVGAAEVPDLASMPDMRIPSSGSAARMARVNDACGSMRPAGS